MGYSEGIVIHVALGVDGQSSFDGISPSMGSRYKPDSQYSHAAYFSNLIYYDINFGPNEAASNNNVGYCTYAINCFGYKLRQFLDHLLLIIFFLEDLEEIVSKLVKCKFFVTDIV